METNNTSAALQEAARARMKEYFSDAGLIEHTEKVLAEALAIVGRRLQSRVEPGHARPPGDAQRCGLDAGGMKDREKTGIGPLGGFLELVVYLAAIFHDIGIPNALRKHRSAAGPYQEREGGAVAGELLTEIGVRPDVRARVCYIVEHHHTESSIDGPDFEVIWDADMLVNVASGNVVPECPKDEFVATRFKTETGRERARLLTPPGGWPGARDDIPGA